MGAGTSASLPDVNWIWLTPERAAIQQWEQTHSSEREAQNKRCGPQWAGLQYIEMHCFGSGCICQSSTCELDLAYTRMYDHLSMGAGHAAVRKRYTAEGGGHELHYEA